MNNKHPYHLVNPSPWPISVSAALLGLTIGGVSYFHFFNKGIYLVIFSFILVAILAGFWWRDLELFTSYLFKTHQHYMFLSIFLLLLALFLSVFLSTKFIGNKEKTSTILL